MTLTIVAIPILLFLTIMAISKKKRVWPIIAIMGITILFGMVNGSQGRYGVSPASFAFLFKNNQIVRIFGSFLLVIIYISRYKFTTLKNASLGILWIIPIMMLIYYIGSGIEGLSDGFLGVVVKMADVVAFYLLVHRLSLEKDFRRKFLTGLAIIGAIFLFINLLALTLDTVHAFRAERFRGIIFSVNWMGTYLALFFIPLFSQYLLSKNKTKIFWLTILLIELVLLILTGARASMLTTIFSFLIFIWFIYKSKIDIKISLKSIISIIFFIFIGISIIITIYPEWFTVVATRLEGNVDTRSLIFENGWGKWTNLFLGMLDEKYGVESVYLTMLYVYGILGFSILVTVFGSLIFKTKVALNKFKSIEGFTGVAIMVGFFINSFFEGLYFGTMSAFNLIFYIGLGLLFSTKKEYKIQRKAKDYA